MRQVLNLLGRAVFIVNSDPPLETKEAFYVAKDRACRVFGRRETPDDIQHIVKDCWHCTRWSCDCCDYWNACCRCKGTNIYLQFWTRLARYRIGDYRLHKPIERLTGASKDEPVTITGYVKHSGEFDFELRRELALWLIVFFNPIWLLRRLHKLSYRPGTPIKYPLSWFLLRIGWVETQWRRGRKKWREWGDERLKARLKRAGLKIEEDNGVPF